MIRGYDTPILFRQDTLIRIRQLKADFAAIEAEMAVIEAKTFAIQEQARQLLASLMQNPKSKIANPDDDPDCDR